MRGCKLDTNITIYNVLRLCTGPARIGEAALSGLLRDAVDPLLGVQRGGDQTLQSVRSQRAGDPEVRARSLERRGLRPEFVGEKPKAGSEGGRG